jgi:aminopeptidase
MDELKSKYVDLLLQTGLNLQAGQKLYLTSEAIHHSFLADIADAAYRAGASYVEVDAGNPNVGKSRILHAAEETLGFIPEYKRAMYEEMSNDDWTRMALVGPEDPDLLKDVDQQRNAALQRSARNAVKPLLDSCSAARISWCLAALPTPRWGAKVFDVPPDADAEEKLWNAMVPILRLDHDSPADTWKQLAATLGARCDALNAASISTLHFEGPGTDLRVALTPKAQWRGGSVQGEKEIPFIPNLPTEEVFTTPDCTKTEGRASVTRPVHVMGDSVEGAWFEFKEGRVVDFGADKGAEQLEAWLGMDDRGRYLGEIALVDGNSPVFQSGLIFHNILYDENAACHFALGNGYTFGIRGGDKMSEEQLRDLGVNISILHTDFMIGSAAINVTGHPTDGDPVPILREGKFVRAFV